MKNKLYEKSLALVAALCTSFGIMAQAKIEPIVLAVETSTQTETRQDTLGLEQLAQGDRFKLFGVRNAQALEFTLRRDQIVKSAELNLVFTPSPALLPKLSHLRVYLNDELMGVVSVEGDHLGQKITRRVPLDPLLMTRFNRVRLEFVGHYTDICEDLTHSALWLDISKNTRLTLNQEQLVLANDLAFFPEPFFDAGDMSTQIIPFVFARHPSSTELKASAVLASYFGKEAQWRDVRFPVSFNKLPNHHSVVFATNDNRPDFLKDYPIVNEPTIELMASADNNKHKMLLVLGRDEEDLVTAVSALVIGNPIFRGRSVSIDSVVELAPRQPYDAPNWVATDRPVYFSELTSYPGELEVSGLMPRPINLNLNLPPDLFVWGNKGIPMELNYRYVAPKSSDESRLTVSINNQYVNSYLLKSSDEKGAFTRLRLPVRGNDTSLEDDKLLLPAFKVGSSNMLRFDFSYASTLGSAQHGMCQTILPVDIRAAIDERSKLDFSGYPHYIEMPNLRVFANSAFPFSRMADLSETIAVVPEKPSALQVSAFLEVFAQMGAQIGYPALKLRVMSDWEQASQHDADILLFGALPKEMKERADANLILQQTGNWLRQSVMGVGDKKYKNPITFLEHAEQKPQSLVHIRALAPMAAIVGLQSEQFAQRSIVGLLTSTDEDVQLLRKALASAEQRATMEGSVVLIRESGVVAQHVGPSYYVGHLAWWKKLWYYLSDKPWLLSGLAFVFILLIALVLWTVLKQVARQRLGNDV